MIRALIVLVLSAYADDSPIRVTHPERMSKLSPDAVRENPALKRGVRGDPERVKGLDQVADQVEIAGVHPLVLLMAKQTMAMFSHASAPSPTAHLLVCAGLFILVVLLSISAVMVGDDGARGKRYGSRGQKHAADSFADTEPSVLVPSLVVPRGKEFLFAIKSVVTSARQSERFDMVDPENQPFCSVLVSEQGPPNPSSFRGMYGILLEHAGESLAFLHTEAWHVKSSAVCPIHRKDGELFGYLMRDRDPPRRYSIVAPHTGDTLLSFHGDFREQSVNVHNGHGQLVATTERQTYAFALDRYVQVRVAPCVDASLVMLGLLGIAKMEG